MDNNALISAGTSAAFVTGLGILYKIWMTIKGRRLISDCCGRRLEVGVDVRDMSLTPVSEEQQSHYHPPSQSVESSHSQHESSVEVIEHHSDLESALSDHKRHTPLTEEDKSVPV